MKKSFLKRVTAAVIALPVALSQTVLFASFAEESNAVEAINIDSFLTVPAGQALYEADSQEYKALGAQQAKDGGADYRYFIQESVWNARVANAVSSYSGETFTIDATSFAQYITGENWFSTMIRNAVADPSNQAYVNVYSDSIDVVADVNYSYEKFAKDILNRSIPSEYKDVDFAFESTGVVDAKVTISGDTTALGGGAGKAARTIPYTVEIEWDGQKLTSGQAIYEKTISVINAIRQDTKASVTKTFAPYEQQRDDAQTQLNEKQAEKDAAQAELDAAVKALEDAEAANRPTGYINNRKATVASRQADLDEAQAQLDAAQAELDAAAQRLEHAHKMVDTKIDEIFDNYVERVNNQKEKYDNLLSREVDTTFNGEDVDAVLAKLDTVVQNNFKNKKVNNVFPASLSEIQGKTYYGTITKIFNNALSQINSQTAEKSTSGTTYSISLTMDEIINKAAEIYDVTAYGKHVSGQESGEGYAYGYLTDDESDADLAKIEALINEKLASEGLELKPGSLYTVKAVEADGNGGIQSGAGTLDIYRIIRFETIEPEETTTETTAVTVDTDVTTDTVASTEETEFTGTTSSTEATQSTDATETTASTDATETAASTDATET
ncbi:MAG TPA: hypothetical protein DCO72_08410, partial [Ruminococcus sp.]|nr:hypothetical protein [Ruminococcus sp.]